MLARGIPRPGRLLVLVLVIYGFMWIKGWPRYYDDEELPPSMRPQSGTALGPHGVGHDHLVVSIVTTATDVYTKLAPALAYLFDDDKDPTLIFSDLQMNVGDFPVFDVLFGYTRDFIGGNKELERYRQQVNFARRSIPLGRLKKQDEHEEAEILAKLNKYKILQAMARAWEYRPDRSWYAFVEDDTFVDRVNTLDWLAQYNPKTKWFFGNPPVSGVSDAFAAGGSSFILSAGAMKELFKERKNVIQNWEKQIIEHTSAFDLVFSVLQAELNLSLTGAWPGISGADPTSVPFSPAVWCERVMMMHHVSPDIWSDLYLLQKNHTEDHIRRPLLFADLWERFMAPEDLGSTRPDWDNLSSDPSNARWNILFESDDPNDGHAPNGEDSPEACEASCESSEYCMQWSYSSIPQKNWNENGQTKCHLSSSLRFGAYSPALEWNVNGVAKLRTWKSGWKKPRFLAWANHQRCKNPAH
ncbi:hypothetical protein FB567DRAFT_440837 [Paraphoma chrysanthemicola]|uniref:N-acetylgalactosaminide beta-1,3-galactosyltransferase n=1 Tax=Paraphoma chrysanthemicola TaxID=798071 RepID=A0A8K0R9T1_9PLEO|nr:hypothetical protein FB567DRAFT_440837 [Paraphoma chrysanthemicola]